MRKTTITITDPMKVKTGDKAFFKGCDFGFTVIKVDDSVTNAPIKIITPFDCAGHWVRSSRFDYATREISEPEWPDPHDLDIRIYLGSDGLRYIYNPASQTDTAPWVVERCPVFRSCESLEDEHHDALPLTELKLVPKDDES